jgi:NAD(P)-dependent dehydrogenase (short-subunit alcohol dehydrogenase family)
MKNRVALITGGTTGIGRATAVAFAEAGARVVVTGRRVEEGKKTVALVEAAGGAALFLPADARREADARMMVERTVAEFGRLDFAFNNAGVEGRFARLEEQTEANYEEVMDINVRGVWLAMKYEIPALRAAGGGAIVNNSSVAGLCGFENCGIYAASKHAVVGLTKVGAIENASFGIRVNAICPGGVQTEMVDRLTGRDPQVEAAFRAAHPLGRLGTVEELARTVVWLCGEASFITGQAIAVDGGSSASFGSKMAFES